MLGKTITDIEELRKFYFNNILDKKVKFIRAINSETLQPRLAVIIDDICYDFDLILSLDLKNSLTEEEFKRFQNMVYL